MVCVSRGGRKRGREEREGGRERGRRVREEGRFLPYTYPLMHPIYVYIPQVHLRNIYSLILWSSGSKAHPTPSPTLLPMFPPPPPPPPHLDLFTAPPPPQVCEALRLLELDRSRLKAYIDQLLAVVLEKTPSLLEGMPRIQQGGGMRLELLTMATLPEVGHLTPGSILIGQ